MTFHGCGASEPRSWFFQLYNAGLQTPNSCAKAPALPSRVHSATNAARFSASGRRAACADLPTTRTLSPGCTSPSHAVSDPNLDTPAPSSVSDAASMIEAVPDSCLLLLRRILWSRARMVAWQIDPSLVLRHQPFKAFLVWIPQLPNGRPDALAKLDVELDRSHPVIV
jgi:hypothetical protein